MRGLLLLLGTSVLGESGAKYDLDARSGDRCSVALG